MNPFAFSARSNARTPETLLGVFWNCDFVVLVENSLREIL